MSFRIAVLDDFQGVALNSPHWRRLPESVELVAFRDHVTDVRELRERLCDVDVVVLMRERTKLSRSLLEQLPRLRLICTTGLRTTAIDFDATAALGILVCGTGSPVSPTAELTWALILAVARRIPQEDSSTRRGEWQHTIGRDLRGTTLGVIGLGTVGVQVARIGTAFGMRVLAWSHNLSPEAARSVGVEPVSKHDLLSQSDVVTLHVRLSERTQRLLGEKEFAVMRPDALLINTSRGQVVDQQALRRALEDGRLGGAGLDVFENEPIAPDDPLLGAPNTVLTPHIGYVTEFTYDVFFRDVAEDISAFLAGEPTRVVARALP